VTYAELNPTNRIRRVIGQKVVVDHVLNGSLHSCEGTLNEFYPHLMMIRVGMTNIPVADIRVIIRGDRVVHRNPAVFASTTVPSRGSGAKF